MGLDANHPFLDARSMSETAVVRQLTDPLLASESSRAHVAAGIRAAGVVRQGSVKRVACGVGERAMAVSFIQQ